MAAANPVLLAFNRGRLSRLALARTDFKRTALSAEVQTNWMPRALGAMMLRPGLGYLGATKDNAAAIAIPFIFAVNDTARLELTDGTMRVWVDDALVTRPVVTTAITNGTFDTNLTGWTDLDTGSAASTWLAGGYMALVGTSTGAARRRQQVAVSGGNIGVRHAVNVSVTQGPMMLRVGSTAGGDEYVVESVLHAGAHSLAFTPSGDFYIDLFNYNDYGAVINSVTIAAAGVMELATPWLAANLPDVRWDQSGDVVFVACSGVRQRRIERRAVDSWSVVVYQCDNGPFMVQNTGPVTITPDGVSGNITLTASAALWKSSHLGALFRLTQTGQAASVELTAQNQWSDPIRIVGVDGTRSFAVIIEGTFTATVTLQYSVATPGDWVDAASGSYTAPTAISYDDTLDNQVIYYRIGIKTGGYTSGTASASLSTPSGSQTGIARITGVSSATSVTAAVLENFGDVTATSDWSESYWSEYRGYPSSVALYGGRLWWAGRDRIWGSVSDDFSSHDDTVEGDSGPISRSIGSGPVDRIYWMLPMQHLVLGAGGSIWTVRSSSLDEPVTPANFNLKDVSGQGSSSVAGVKIDTNGAYVQRSGLRIYEAAYDGGAYSYACDDLAAHVPEIGEPAIVRLAIQRQPETRLHCIRSDGTVAILIFDKREEVQCWVDFETDGEVEDVVVEPGDVEDRVTYLVNRDGARFYERWAMEGECIGGTISKLADSFITVEGYGDTITGLNHLEGREVVCWADGRDKGVFTVSGGSIAQPYTSGAVVGLGYEARYKSTKLAYGLETALTKKKRLSQLGVIAVNLHPQGLQYGPDFEVMDDLPAVEQYEDVDPDAIWAEYDEETFSFPGDWSTDSRLCLRASAPRPVTLLACVLGMEANG